MPLELADFLVRLSGGNTILDPFAGSGTTGLAARDLDRRAILIELNESYCQLAADRLPAVARPDLRALGFLTVGRRFEGNLEAPQLIIDDRIDTIGRGMLGLTLACARCHVVASRRAARMPRTFLA